MSAANAVLKADIFQRHKQATADQDVLPSRAFTYYQTRLLEGTQDSDGGAQIRDAIKSLIKFGVCPEAAMPYTDKDFTTAPSKAALKAAQLDQLLSYHRIADHDLRAVKDALARGFVVVFGMLVFEQFESETCAKTGLVAMPPSLSALPAGGHAVVATGYNDNAQWIIGDNSWGVDWGDQGRFYLPYAYFDEIQYCTSDLWVMKKVE
ncbi:MAG: C1 family peptidase [Kiritimatiellaeota bacterium]|nr:C1 family peptidase [Kiritimatiellota bacterium]